MPTHTFTGPSTKEARTGRCPTCGKPSQRSRTFEKTVNPFNKHAAVEFRDAMARALAWITEQRLPIRTFEVKRVGDTHGTRYVASVVFIDGSEVPVWARALGVDPVRVEDGGHCDYARMRADVAGLRWRVDGVLRRASGGDRFGGAMVEWKRESNGRKSKYGTVPLDELEAGLLRMGVAVVTLPASEGAV